MSVKEACKLVITSSLIKSKNNFFAFDMGKPIKIFDLMNKIFDYLELNRKEIKIKFTKLKKGEKLKEEISISKRYKQTKFKKILSFKERVYSIKEVMILIDELRQNLNAKNQNNLVNSMKKFLKKEL